MFNRKLSVCALLASGLFTGSSQAAFDLQVTEMWPGNEPGSNLTADWFEVTNYGDTAWTAAVDGNLYFDDDSFSAANADPMTGIASIAPGESVVFINASSTTQWLSVWGPDLAVVPQLGIYPAGSGLSQGGDAIGLFLDADFNGPQAGELFETAVYPSANNFGGQSFDTVLGAFSTAGNEAGAIATTTVNNSSQPAVGSPGSVVPEPASIALLGLGALAFGRHKRSV